LLAASGQYNNNNPIWGASVLLSVSLRNTCQPTPVPLHSDAGFASLL
jgi:hypothetical protein